eukprot:gene634-351_t
MRERERESPSGDAVVVFDGVGAWRASARALTAGKSLVDINKTKMNRNRNFINRHRE